MTIKIQATRLSAETDANAVAGAAAGEIHELTGKLHATESGYEMKLDAMGAESAADVELALMIGEGGGEGGGEKNKSRKKRDIVVKVASGRRSFVSLPDDADESSVCGELGDGAFTVRCGKK